MIGTVLSHLLRRKLRSLSFPAQRGRDAKATTAEALECFELGAHAALTKARPQAIAALELRIPWYRRFFFWEGCACGLSGRHALAPWGNPDLARMTSRYRAMHFTGYGFWNGVARVYHLPRVPLTRERWAVVPDYDRLSPLIAGGAAFAITCAHGVLDSAVLERVKVAGNPDWTRAAFHGCGRALWFLYMHDVGLLEAAIEAHPEASSELIEGVGVAIAFTQLSRPRRILATIDRFPPAMQPGLLRGAGICLYQSIEEDPAIRPFISRIKEQRLRQAHSLCERAATSVADGPGWYWGCDAKLRSLLPDLSPSERPGAA